MRSALMTSLLLMAAILLGSAWQTHALDRWSQRYISAAKEIRIMVEDEDWQRAGGTVSAYAARWDEEQAAARMIAEHGACDDVTESIMLLRVGIIQRHRTLCLLGCERLEAAAAALAEDIAPSPENLL